MQGVDARRSGHVGRPNERRRIDVDEGERADRNRDPRDIPHTEANQAKPVRGYDGNTSVYETRSPSPDYLAPCGCELTTLAGKDSSTQVENLQ